MIKSMNTDCHFIKSQPEVDADQESCLLVFHFVLERKVWIQLNALEIDFPYYSSILMKTYVFISFLYFCLFTKI